MNWKPNEAQLTDSIIVKLTIQGSGKEKFELEHVVADFRDWKEGDFKAFLERTATLAYERFTDREWRDSEEVREQKFNESRKKLYQNR